MQRIEDDTLTLTESNFDTPHSVVHEGKSYPLPKNVILKGLLTANPDRKVFYKNEKYYFSLPKDALFQGSPPLRFPISLGNDIVRRTSVGSQKKVPEVIFKPVWKKIEGKSGKPPNYVRTMQPHVIYKPVVGANDEVRYSVLPREVNLKAISMQNMGNPRYQFPGQLGRGVFGVVFPVLATLQEKASTVLFKTHKKRVLKAQLNPESDGDSEGIKKEDDFLVISGHLDTKGLTEDNLLNFLTQKRGGNSFSSYLRDNKTKLTPSALLLLSMEVLRSQKEQLHDRGLVSRDIKPPNLVGSGKHLLNIDLGLAKKIIDGTDQTACGTPAYVSPEVFRGSVADERADIFSGGILLAEMWGKEPDRRMPLQIQLGFSLGNPVDLSTLFDGLPIHQDDHLSSEEKNNIRKIIENLVSFYRDQRISIEEALQQFEKVFIDHQIRLGAIPEHAKEQVIQAGNEAMALREQLKRITNPDEYIIENFTDLLASARQAEPPINLKAAKDLEDDLNKIIGQYEKLAKENEPIPAQLEEALEQILRNTKQEIWYLEQSLGLPNTETEKLKQALLTSIEKLSDTPEAIETFVRKLEISALDGVNNKKELIARITKIINGAEEKRNELIDIRNKLTQSIMLNTNQKDRREEFLRQIDKILGKEITLDNLSAINSEQVSQIIANARTFHDENELSKKLLENLSKLLALNERIEKNLHLMECIFTRHTKIKATWNSLKAVFKEIDDLLSHHNSLDIMSMSTKDLTQHNMLLANHLDQFQPFIEDKLKWIQDLAPDDRTPLPERKKQAQLALESRIEDAKSLEQIEAIYRDMKTKYQYLRIEQGGFSFFGKTGTTTTWGDVMESLQQQAIGILQKKKFAVTETEDKTLKEIFSEKTKRVSFSNPYLAEYTSQKSVPSSANQSMKM